MNLYTQRDIELFDQHIKNIQTEVKRKTFNLLEPTGDMQMEIINKLLSYVKKTKRKIYGSYSHNQVVKIKNKDDSFLEECDIPDIDFYSPEPIHDLYEICNMFHKLGYNDVLGIEAQHEGTYKVFVNGVETCDISYVPTNIYNRIPYLEIDGYVYVHPQWAMIDYFRIMTDPMTSWEQKLEKRFRRLYLLQKHYPFYPSKKQVSFTFKPEEKKEMISVVNKIYRYCIDKSSIIISGAYALNYYKQYVDKNAKITDIPVYQLYSTQYKKDARELVEMLKDKLGSSIRYEEHYPYFQFIDFFTMIYYKDKLICLISGNNKKCLPYHKVPAVYFEKNMAEKNEGTVNIASFSLLILNSLILYFYFRTNDEKYHKDICSEIIYQLIKLRNNYFKKYNKNIFTSGLLRDFIIDCIGQTQTSRKEANERAKENIANNKPAIFKYKPSTGVKNDAHEYQFKNSSGNVIRNKKNLKLSRIKN